MIQEKVDEEDTFRSKAAVVAANRQERGSGRRHKEGDINHQGAPPNMPPSEPVQSNGDAGELLHTIGVI